MLSTIRRNLDYLTYSPVHWGAYVVKLAKCRYSVGHHINIIHRYSVQFPDTIYSLYLKKMQQYKII